MAEEVGTGGILGGTESIIMKSMHRSMWRWLGLLLCCGLVPAAEPQKTTNRLPPPTDHPISFSKDIKPLFESSCIQCHAKGKDKGGFSLETRDGFLKGGDTGPAAIPGIVQTLIRRP